MNTRRLIPALAAALVISAICTFLLARVIHANAGKHPKVRQYLAAKRPIAPGEVIKADALTPIDWPASQPIQGAYSRPAELVGRAAIYPVAAGQPIIDKDLASAGAELGLTNRIPEGMRAIALKSDDVVGVAGFVFPGSHVDVLVTYRTDRSPEPMTATVLQDAEVLADGHQTQPSPDGKPATVDVVTLLLTPQNAERVVLASTQGTIHFVLRNGSDREHVDGAPAQLSQFGAAPAAPAPVAHHAALVAVSRAKPSYSVETILGDKSSKTEF